MGVAKRAMSDCSLEGRTVRNAVARADEERPMKRGGIDRGSKRNQ